ncbi:MAG TPA: hypothetical protein VIY73_00410, partial [Polyangiaceae bacterium]
MRRAAAPFVAVIASAFAFVAACDRRPPSQAPSSSAAATSGAAASSGTVPPTALATSAGAQPIAGGTPCGDLGCTQFDAPKDAFLTAIAGDPRVI